MRFNQGSIRKEEVSKGFLDATGKKVNFENSRNNNGIFVLPM